MTQIDFQDYIDFKQFVTREISEFKAVFDNNVRTEQPDDEISSLKQIIKCFKK